MDLTNLAILKKIADLEARVKKLEPSTNLFDISVIAAEAPDLVDVETGTFMAEYQEYYTSAKFSDICPRAVIGRTYTFTCEYEVYYGSGAYIGYDGGYHALEGTFVLDELIYNSNLLFFNGQDWYEDPDSGNSWPEQGCCYFVNIRLNEGDTALPWEPYR